MDVKSFIKAARLRTLPLSVSGIIVGSILGNQLRYNHSVLNDAPSVLLSSTFWLAILTTMGFSNIIKFCQRLWRWNKRFG